MRIRRSPLIGLFLAAMLGVGACSGGADPKSTFTPTSTYSFPGSSGTPSVTGSTPPPRSTSPAPVATTGPNVRPGEKPPVLPAAAKHNTLNGAAAFAMFWIRTLDWGYATTDSTLARRYFSPSCTDCARFMKNFDGPRAKGEHFRGGRITILGWQAAPNDGRDGATRAVDVTISAGSLDTLDASGHVVAHEPPVARITYRLWLKWTGHAWTVVQKGLVKS